MPGGSNTDLRMSRGFIITASIIVIVSLVSLFGLTSLNLPFINPSDVQQTILLFVLSTIIFLGLVIFGFILFRSLLKLYLERRANQLGSKFKTKLVCGALGLSLLPVCFLFLFSYSLINRTLDKWFSRPFETMSEDTRQIVDTLGSYARSKAAADAKITAAELKAFAVGDKNSLEALDQKLKSLARPEGVDLLAVIDGAGRVLAERVFQAGFPALSALPNRDLPSPGQDSSRLFEARGGIYVLGGAPFKVGQGTGSLIVGAALPAHISESAARLDQESADYGKLSQQRKFLRKTYISILLLLTVVILFVATWFALFLSRQITVPIQALAEATREVSRGNLEFRVQTKAADELGILVRSFNEMTGQLAVGREELEKSRNHLEQMNLQLDQRRQFTEAILESIPTGVISVSARGAILGSNPAANRLFGRDVSAIERFRTGQLSDFFTPRDVRELEVLMRRAARAGQAARQMELKVGGRVAHLAVTVSALADTPTATPGAHGQSGRFVVVLEDMSDLLRAQKEAAWCEVAQRIAHEIKNPLTPIALSAERIHLWMERQRRQDNGSGELNQVIQESCSLIRQEVESLKRLVDGFSQLSRFPKALPSRASINQIIDSALSLYNGRLDGVSVRLNLDPNLPSVQADTAQFRRVFVNLIDNATEAMENSAVRELTIETRNDPRREIVQVTVSDTGHGVSAEDMEKLFLPYFSTKERGTGLGLAIVSRIVAEHDGAIRVEENRPAGARFVIELPVLSSSAVA